MAETMRDTQELALLERDVHAMMVPSGARIILQEGTEVTVVQSLGNSYTVNVFGNLARIEGHDADALGKEPTSILEDLPPDMPLQDKCWRLMQTVYDPEIPVNIVDLGLIYDCELKPAETEGQFNAKVTMTLTAPGCGMGPVLVEDVKAKLEMLPEINAADVELTFDPPWTKDRMSEEAQLELGLF